MLQKQKEHKGNKLFLCVCVNKEKICHHNFPNWQKQLQQSLPKKIQS